MGGPVGVPEQPEAALSLAARHLTRVTALPVTQAASGQRGKARAPLPRPLPPLEYFGLSLMAAPAPMQHDATLELKRQRVVS